MDPIAVIARRLRVQRLAGERFGSPAEAVSALGAVQAQEYGEAKWSLAQRCGHPGDAAVERAVADGEILRTHVLRPTWHFVTPEDIGWMLELTGPRVLAANRGWFRQNGLDEDQLERCAEVCMAALAESSPLTRLELREALRAAGIEVDGPKTGLITLYLELEALVCNGPHEGVKPTYVPLADRVNRGRGLRGDEALTELTARYFASHGPATVTDFAWWSGLTLTASRRGLELCGERFEAHDDDVGRTWHAEPERWADPPAPEGALMLGSFDELTVAYRDVRTVSPAGEPGRTLPLRPLLVDGRLAGSWKRKLRKGSVLVEAAVFSPLDGAEEAAVAAEAERLGEHLCLESDLRITRGAPVAAA